MELWADTHVHLYPEYQPERVFESVWRQWSRPDQNQAREVGIFLVEVAGMNAFQDVRDGVASLPSGYDVEQADDTCLRITRCPVNGRPQQSLWCFAGRQIMTAERLEILGLVMADEVPDGLAGTDAVRHVLDRGGIPVLAWGLGKWLFRRAAVIRQLLDQFGPDHLWIGDNAIRPRGWPASRPLRDGQRRILAGTDPLPMAGDEAMVGTYGVRFSGGIDPQSPSVSAHQLLHSAPSDLRRIGQRNQPLATALRMWRYYRRPNKPVRDA